MTIKTEWMRVDPVFKEELERIKIERIKNGLDKRERSTRRLTRGIIRHPEFEAIKKDLGSLELNEGII
jgi:hypothetical protein